ncbi:MAG: putative porin [Bacteroidota bacterium]
MLRSCKNNLFFILFFCYFFNTTAQVFYPTDSSYISSLTQFNKNNYQLYQHQKIDTTLTDFQNYFQRNTSGNYGLASNALLLSYQTQPLGFNFYTAPYQNDLIQKNNVQYYQTKGPLASLTGIAGNKQEQNFKLLFSNTIKKKLNITLGFNRYGSLGFYKKQQSFTNNIYISSNYTNSSNRIGYHAFFLFNKIKHQENGGLKTDTAFTKNLFINKELLGINLTDAKREVRFITYNFNPWFRLNKTEDSSTVFSHFINYEFEYNRNYSKYRDLAIKTDKYYQHTYLDTALTNDSSSWQSIHNAISYAININPIHAKFLIGFKNEYNLVYQFVNSTFQNNIVNTGLSINKKKYTGLIKADYIVSGRNSNDYLIEINNQFSKKIKLKNKPIAFNIYMNSALEKRHADYIYNKWMSNHYEWKNNFFPTEKFQSIIGMSSLDNASGIGLIFQNIKNQIFLNDSIIPEQISSSIQNVSFFIHKNFLFFRHLGLNVKYNYQYSSRQDITSMPNHLINGALFYQGSLYKNALQLQIGFNASYYSEFIGMAYSPALNTYYLQNKKTVGNYPYIDFFINARIKPVRFFIKIDHVTQGFFGSNYSLTPYYIQNDRAFKFGINWLFFD